MEATLTLVVTFCALFTSQCDRVPITNNTFDPELTPFTCMMAQPKIAQWQRSAPKYSSWRFTGWRCQQGKFEIARPL